MKRFLLLAAILLVPTVAADTFTENFEAYVLGGFNPNDTPDQSWFNFAGVGHVVSLEPPTLNGTKWFRAEADVSSDASGQVSNFNLEIPATLTETTFNVKANPYSFDNQGTKQFIKIQSSAPIRTMVEFYVFCADSANPNGCELKVRWENVDSTGQTLINTTLNQTAFRIRIVPDWLTGQFRLYVNGTNDGLFPFLELPDDIGRIQFGQYRADVPMTFSFDEWTVVGAVNGTATSLDSDVAEGIKNFATDVRFTTAGSKFFFGFILFIIICAAVIVPLLALGLDNTILPAIAFFTILVGLWMINMEFWPDWIGIGLIVLVAALIGTVTRRLVLGIKDANSGPSLVAGSLGYFIIATSLLAFSGYATDTIQIPTSPSEQQGVNTTTNPDQTFIGSVAECIFTGGVFTFGLRGDCSQDTVSTTWKQITDVFGWVRAAFNFLFQLLTFQLPIPVIFNVMIVLPPAAALATYAIQTIRGFSSS